MCRKENEWFLAAFTCFTKKKSEGPIKDLPKATGLVNSLVGTLPHIVLTVQGEWTYFL